MNLLACCWPLTDAGACLSALTGTEADLPPCSDGDLERYLDRAAARLACETTQLTATLGDLDQALRDIAPALIRLDANHLAAIVDQSERHITLLDPSLRKHRFPLKTLTAALREPAAAHHKSEIDRVLPSTLGRKREAAIQTIAHDRIASLTFRDCWTVRPDAGANIRPALRQSGVQKNVLKLIAVHAFQYVLWLTAWAVLGRVSLSGQVDRGTLLGWALLLFTTVPLQLAASRLQGRISIGFSGTLKRRLLCGITRLRPDEVRTGGIGTFLAQALEAESVEELALGGGLSGLLAIFDLLIAGLILGRYSCLLVLWLFVLAACAARFFKAFHRWTTARSQMSSTTAEAMLGHRTRLTQQDAARLHTTEDATLALYHQLSTRLDSARVLLLSSVPRSWLLLGLLIAAPVLADANTLNTLAIRLGGVLLAYGALAQLASAATELTAVVAGSRTLKPLFDAATRRPQSGVLLTRPPHSGRDPILEADHLSFTYSASRRPVLTDCSLTVKPGDRILMEGPSGGGKTTFATLLAGLRDPHDGLLLASCMDKRTLGDSAWTEQISAVPQFHENHVFSESLAFNLLLGRNWPPTSSDLASADHVCRGLGLGPLLDRMPNGLLQMLGDGGWQLSHGERSRLFMARALLNGSNALILDETFGSLDPENMRQCLEFALDQPQAIIAIAHP